MISRQQLIDSLVKECNVCKHLYTKFPAGTYDYRPSEKQRSALELMRYLSMCGEASIHVMLNNSDWKNQWKPFSERAAQMTPEEFPAAMDRQAEAITKMINAIPEEQFASLEVKHPTGEAMPLGAGLVRMPMAWLTAYRMQLFLYAKQAGAQDLTTSNCWHGRDRAQ